MRTRKVEISWLAGFTTGLALLSCYGTTVLLGLLGMVGISVAVNEEVWAGVIIVLASLASIAITISARQHGRSGPAALAVGGLALIVYTLTGVYHSAVELAGFGLLAAASVWVWQVRIRQGRTDTDPSWIEAGSLAKRLRPEDVCPINSSHGDTAVRIEHPAEEVK